MFWLRELEIGVALTDWTHTRLAAAKRRQIAPNARLRTGIFELNCKALENPTLFGNPRMHASDPRNVVV